MGPVTKKRWAQRVHHLPAKRPEGRRIAMTKPYHAGRQPGGSNRRQSLLRKPLPSPGMEGRIRLEVAFSKRGDIREPKNAIGMVRRDWQGYLRCKIM